MRRWLLLLGVLLVLVLAGAGGAYLGFRHLVTASQDGPVKAETVVIKPGAGLSQIAATLAAVGAVDEPLLFNLYVRSEGMGRALKAGEYKLQAGESIAALAARMARGDVFLRQITVPEGLSSAEVVKILQAEPMLIGEIEVMPREGTLLPETYAFVRGETREAVLARMRAAFAAEAAALWVDRAFDLPLASLEEAIVLASIVEKETGIAAERAKVAGVFINRLRRGMKLQSDPTVVYGVEQALGHEMGRPLSKRDLATSTPYNTYTIAALPPTPICNPGKAALQAVLQPEETDYLYFVADGTGGHVFAKTLAEHNRNVAAWRKIERQRKRGAGS